MSKTNCKKPVVMSKSDSTWTLRFGSAPSTMAWPSPLMMAGNAARTPQTRESRAEGPIFQSTGNFSVLLRISKKSNEDLQKPQKESVV